MDWALALVALAGFALGYAICYLVGRPTKAPGIKPRQFVIVLLCLSLMAPACATFKTNPTQTDIDKTRKAAIICMNSITTGLGIYESMLEVADVQERSGQVPTAVLRDLAKLGKEFASASDKSLTILGKVTTMPSLNTTVAAVVEQLIPLIQKLESSGKDSLRSFGFALRVILDLLSQYVAMGQPSSMELSWAR